VRFIEATLSAKAKGQPSAPAPVNATAYVVR